MKPPTKSSLQILLITLGIILLLSIAAQFFLSQNNNIELPTEIKIIDGDTFQLEGETIRLLCVDTPEAGEQGYQEASDFLFQLIYNKNLTMQGNKTDVYGRSLRWVYSDGILVNKEILDAGFGILFEFEGEDCSLIK